MPIKITSVLTIAFLFIIFCTNAQTPTNIDFESGLGTWAYFSGTVAAGPVFTLASTAPVPSLHTQTSGSGVDPYGGFPIVAPGGGLHSFKLGKDSSNYNTDRATYFIHIPGTGSYSLLYKFAVVLNDGGHPPTQQPRFIINAEDSVTSAVVPCVNRNYVISSTIPGFVPASTAGVYFKPWTTGNMKFLGFSGRTVRLDITAAGCSNAGHWGYGYFDVSAALFANTINAPCAGTSMLLSGPDGYSAYAWYDSATFTTSYGSSQNVTISAPGVLTTYAVILTPFTGYGCPDTLYTKVIPAIVCTGAPPVGTAMAYSGVGCGDMDTLMLSGVPFVCGYTYQWQSSPDNLTWTNITGATASVYPYYNPYVSLYYRCVVRCTGSGLTTNSNAVFVPRTPGPSLHTVMDPPDTICDGANFYVSTCGGSTAFNVTTWYGDGTTDNHVFTTTGVRHANFYHSYPCPGTYTVKQILFDGTLAVDSTTFSYHYLYCSTLPVKMYIDNNTDCIYNSGDARFFKTVKTKVDSNGIAIDTISSLGAFYYKALGSPGTIYTFNTLPDMFVHPACPSGSFSDTIVPFVNLYNEKQIGFNCGTSPVFDLSVNATVRCGRHEAIGTVIVKNNGCTASSVVLKFTKNPKYPLISSYPMPTTVVGNEVFWSLGTISATDTLPRIINFYLDISGPDLAIGDTVNSIFDVTPFSGDYDTANNVIIRNDTVKSGFDPNFIEVSPQGFITAGTQLQYAIHFENTGNDTAFNIHVMDTLSDFLDIHSLNIITASSAMDIYKYTAGGHNIVKFDFPRINLLDSSHHGLADGMLVYTINTWPGLPLGTIIPNRAGIYFDDNDVVMTNTVNNIIGTPPVALGSQVLQKDKVVLYPNPTSDELTVRATSGTFRSYTITNELGQVVKKGDINGNATSVHIWELPAGLYIVSLRGDTEATKLMFVKN